LGNQNHIDSTFTKFVVSPLYLYPKITGLYRLATLSNKRTYEVDNRLALILYDYVEVATADCRVVDVQQVSCFSEGDGLDQQRGYSSGDLKKMGRKKKQKPSSMGPKAIGNSTNIGPSFTNFITRITDPSKLCALELGNRKSQRNKAKKLTRRTQSFKRRKSRKMGNQSSKHSGTVIIEYSVSDNEIKNRNAIIRSVKELVSEDETSSSLYRSSTNSIDQAHEPSHPDT